MANDGYDSPDHDSSGDSEAPPPEYYAGKGSYTDAENSFAMVASVWWSFTWRFVLIFIVVSFLIGFVMTLASGGNVETAERWGGALSLILAIPISIWSMGKALSCKHKQHRIIFSQAPQERED